MVAEILLALVAVAVTFLVARDSIKTRIEVPHPDVDDQRYQSRLGATMDDRNRVPEVFTDSNKSAAGPLADDSQSAAAPQVADATARPETGSRHVRSRLQLLAITPAVAAAIITLCVVRIAGRSSHHSGVPASVLALGIAAVVVLLVTILIMTMTARSVLRPLYRLRTRALEMASGQPPAADQRTGAREYANDEIGDIARVLDQMSGEMTRLAGNEAGLRGKLDAMFVNLSQRGRSLSERQMRLLDSLQRGELDRDRMAGLTRMNRLAARMHRTSQNLLVLAGHEVPSGWNQPAPLADMVRAAMSEIEEPERITLYAQPDVAVSGPAVGDVINILVELIQNATSFSSTDMPVEISSRLLNEGGALIAVTDRGVGMTAKELAYTNWQLEHPPGAEIDVPKSVGLLVVARLATRHGVRTRLQQAEFGGLTALVWLPEEIIARQLATPPPRLAGAGLARGAHEAAAAGGAASSRKVGFTASAADVETGRRLVAEAGRRPGPAWTAVGSRSAPAAPRSPIAPAQSPAAPAQPTPVPTTADRGVETWAPVSEPFRPGQLAESGWTPPGRSGMLSGDATAATQESNPRGRRVVVPSAEPPEEMRRLPIFDSVESSWFGGGDHTVSAAEDTVPAPANRWSSAADEGWRAAEIVEAPASAGSTAAGLPRRQPNANLVPGAIRGQQSELPTRSPAAVRDRLARFQRGVSAGRAAASDANPDQDEQSSPAGGQPGDTSR